MADAKISALTNLTAADAINDMIPIVDVSDTPPASGNTKRISINNILSSSPTASGALTVTGLVTAGSATITGAATVGTTLGVTGASNLSGVVTVSATAIRPLDLSNSAVTTEREIKIENSTVIAFLGVEPAAGGRFLGSAANNAYFGTNGAYGLEFATGNNVRMTLNTTGNLAFKDGLGIDFSAKTPDGSGTVGSEILNDYEEGTWVGTLTGGTTTPATPQQATGKYTKIGRQVSVQIAFETVSTIGYAGSLSITGLPFTNAALRTIGTAGTYIGATFTGTLISQIEASNSSILFYGIVSNSAWASATHNPNAGSFFWTNLTYTV